MPAPLLVQFLAGRNGSWHIDAIRAVRGDGLAHADRLNVVETVPIPPDDSSWVLRGVTGSARYTNRDELDSLAAKQSGLGRRASTCAALIPIRKTDTLWQLAQDERRTIMEERSHHIAIGLAYLPAVARRLHHGRELGEPFDFLTWFEFAPSDGDAFDEMLALLRATEEWRYVDREVEIRLSRELN